MGKIIVLEDVVLYDKFDGKQLDAKLKRGDELRVITEQLCYDGKTWMETLSGWIVGITNDKHCCVHKCY